MWAYALRDADEDVKLLVFLTSPFRPAVYGWIQSKRQAACSTQTKS